MKQQFFSSQSDFEIPGYPQLVLDPGDTSHVKAVVKTATEIILVQNSPRIYKGRIDGDRVNLIRACKKVLYQLVYIGKKFVFLKELLYLLNQ